MLAGSVGVGGVGGTLARLVRSGWWLWRSAGVGSVRARVCVCVFVCVSVRVCMFVFA